MRPTDYTPPRRVEPITEDDLTWPGWVKALVILALTAVLWFGVGQIAWAFARALMAGAA